MEILVILEDNRGTLHRLSKEAIAGAQTLGGSVSALVIGQNSDKLVSEISEFDLDQVITVNHDLVLSYNADGYSEVTKQVIEYFSPKTVVVGLSLIHI